MKIAFIHYHLKTGGVTSVLRQQVKAIEKTCETLVLTGEPSESAFPADTVVIPGLGYTVPSMPSPPPYEVAENIIQAIFAKWETGCDVLHVHNPLLSKNKNFLKIIKILQERNLNLFLQIHDFAEDGRPLSYYQEEYPADCHYGVINARDYGILINSGLKPEGLHTISNMVRHLNTTGKTVRENLVLYPIRAIRRKNIGEALLLSLFFKHKEILAITLPPNSPSDMKSYNDWKQFSAENELRVEFESGIHSQFEKLVDSSKFLITTSITEGFGFQFLEPWTANKMLFGRKLPGICDDFETNGVRLDHLYNQLLIPLEWIGKDRFYEKWASTVLNTASRFNLILNQNQVDEAFAEMTNKERIDFGMLDESFQKRAISLILSDKQNAHALISLNSFLEHFGEKFLNDRRIPENKKIVLNKYNDINYSKTLLSIYQKAIHTQIHHRIDKKELLSQFLNLQTFSLLKWAQ